MRRPRSTTLVALLSTQALLLGIAAPAAASDVPRRYRGHQLTVDEGTQSNAYRRSEPQSSFAWRLEEGDGPRLWARNRAKATTHCEGCRAVAVSVEVVLASHMSRQMEVINVSRSVTDCSRCASTALAYQFVVVHPGRLKLRPQSRARIMRIVGRMRRVALSGASDPTIRREEFRLARQLAAELERGVVRLDERGSRAEGAS